jgi:DNA polymerase III subunit delta'
MANDSEDPREGAWHPRHTPALLGRQKEVSQFLRAFHSGKLHHAWLLTGSKGIGKASLAYKIASYVLNGNGKSSDQTIDIPDYSKSSHWIAGRAHPDLFVLERALTDTKPKRLKAEIAVDDARKVSDFFEHTASGAGWRVAIVDAADDLNNASANALLKLIEEPPPRCVLLLVCHQPGKLLRTIRSRCSRMAMAPLQVDDVISILNRSIEGESSPAPESLGQAATLSGGSPGQARQLLVSEGAKAFAAYERLAKFTPAAVLEFSNRFVGKTLNSDDFQVFFDLMLNWLGSLAKDNASKPSGAALAAAHEQISYSIRQTNALNLDRRQAVIDAVTLIDDAKRAT